MGSSQLPWINDQRPVRIGVVGDLILDEYLEGQVHRISPEAPVPVHLVSHSFFRAGGAANAALNIQLSGGEALLFGVCGDDEAAVTLRKLLNESAVATDHIVTDPERPTIRKTRISANRQQIVRVDWEKVVNIAAAVQAELLARLNKVKLDALLISDYGKGGLPSAFIHQVITTAERLKIPVIIDPKGKDYSRYSGAFLITPNRNEACEALGLESSESVSKEDLGRQLQEKFAVQNVLLTLGAAGMLLYPNKKSGQTPHYLPAQAREVYDVSGAGDTVAAIMALAIGCGCELQASMQLANTAAGIVVGKWGTQPVYRRELEELLTKESSHTQRGVFSTARKIMTTPELKTFLGPSQQRRQTVVFTNGCFDLLHAGHIAYLEKARSRGDLLVVGINSDASVRKIKGSSRPVVECAERMRLIAALACVDYVVSFDEETPAQLIAALVPNVLIKGADWPVDKIVGADVVRKAGGVVDNVELVPGLSTSEIIRRVKSGEGVGLA